MKLSQSIRDKIIKAAVKGACEKEAERLRKQEHKLGMKLYAKLYPAAEREAAAQLPAGWVHLDGCLRIAVGGMDMTFTVDEKVPVKTDNNGYCRRLGIVVDEKLQQEALDLHSAKEAIKQRGKELHANLRAVLESVNTYKQLSEIWPEGKKFYEQFKPMSGGRQVPTVQMQAINEMLGLKTEPAA